MIEKKQISYDEYKMIQEIAEITSKALGKKENKNFVKIRFPFQNYKKISIDESDFYFGGTNIFIGIIQNVLLDAHHKYPEKFGNNNAFTVLSALNKTKYLHHKTIEAIRIYKNENHLWVFDDLMNGIDYRILRLDLFRELKPVPNEKMKWEFIGGILHVLKHFSFNGRNLSTGRDINDVPNIEYVVFLIIKAFYNSEGEFDESGKNYIVLMELNKKYNLKFVFYYEEITKVYFIKTLYKERIKTKK
jgi:hypothetical protein